MKALTKTNPDLLYLQIDPMPYVTRQRYMSHKCALHGIEEYSVKAIENLNLPNPISFEECIVDLLILDMSYANQIHTNLDYTKGFYTYSYKSLQLKSTHDNLRDKFIGAITDYVIADKWSPYHEINNILYEGLMGKQKVLLGDMPELLLRQILGNSLSIKQVKDMFKIVLNKIDSIAETQDETFIYYKGTLLSNYSNNGNQQTNNGLEEEQEKNSLMRKITLDIFSHVILAPKDLYMTALLKNTATKAIFTAAFVGQPHFIPMQKYWTPPPYGINFTSATKIPDRLPNESNEDLIEKQAIFDVLLGTRLWSEKYILNPFPYINDDITKISDIDSYKKCFYINLKKYQLFRDSVINKFITKKIEYEEKHKDKIPYKETIKLEKL